MIFDTARPVVKKRFALDYAMDWIHDLTGMNSYDILRELHLRMYPPNDAVIKLEPNPDARAFVADYDDEDEPKPQPRGARRSAYPTPTADARWKVAWECFRGEDFRFKQVEQMWKTGSSSATFATIKTLIKGGRMAQTSRGIYHCVPPAAKSNEKAPSSSNKEVL